MSKSCYVVMGIQDWESPIGSNCIDIALELAQQDRVLYVNPSVDRVTSLKEFRSTTAQRRRAIRRRERPQVEQIRDSLWVLTPTRLLESINWLPDGRGYDWLNYANNARLAQEIRSALAKLNFTDVVLFNDGSMFRGFYLKEMLRPSCSVYYSRDYFLAVPYWQRHGRRLEPALMAKSDLVATNSLYLADLARKHNPNAFYIGQGCDLAQFDPTAVTSIAPAVAAIPSPRIGYLGALLDLRLEILLLENIARQQPDWQLVLVGPEDEAFQKSALHQMPNVHFLGPQPPDALAQYLAGFDVALNPQKISDVTLGNYPRKIDEYIAMGKPTVATYTPTMEAFQEYVYLANQPEDYVGLIERALQEDTPDRQAARRAFALTHTWAKSVAELRAAIEKTKHP